MNQTQYNYLACKIGQIAHLIDMKFGVQLYPDGPIDKAEGIEFSFGEHNKDNIYYLNLVDQSINEVLDNTKKPSEFNFRKLATSSNLESLIKILFGLVIGKLISIPDKEIAIIQNRYIKFELQGEGYRMGLATPCTSFIEKAGIKVTFSTLASDLCIGDKIHISGSDREYTILGIDRFEGKSSKDYIAKFVK